MSLRRNVKLLLGLLLVFCFQAIANTTQERDHLTPQEVDLVKDAQELDKRVDVFVKAADRRLLVISGGIDSATAKQLKKDAESWGELPTGSRAELVGDIARILDEALREISLPERTNLLLLVDQFEEIFGFRRAGDDRCSGRRDQGRPLAG